MSIWGDDSKYTTFQPDDGWWLFREQSFSHDQLLLIVNGHVAYDDEWENQVGRPPSECMSENYWEGNPTLDMTFGPLTRGEWASAVGSDLLRTLLDKEPA